jgi:hypothetical protein
MPPSEATWEPVDQFRQTFRTFQLEDELFVEGGGGEMLCTREGGTREEGAGATTRGDHGGASMACVFGCVLSISLHMCVLVDWKERL